jgi:hypothetical protein
MHFDPSASDFEHYRKLKPKTQMVQMLTSTTLHPNAYSINSRGTWSTLQKLLHDSVTYPQVVVTVLSFEGEQQKIEVTEIAL